jgi:hypothetical protein
MSSMCIIDNTSTHLFKVFPQFNSIRKWILLHILKRLILNTPVLKGILTFNLSWGFLCLTTMWDFLNQFSSDLGLKKLLYAKIFRFSYTKLGWILFEHILASDSWSIWNLLHFNQDLIVILDSQNSSPLILKAG